jgi:hypothetical protein
LTCRTFGSKATSIAGRRYFGVDGRLIGQRNGTDYGEFCGGKANLQYAGRSSTARPPLATRSDHLLRSSPRRPVQIPIDLFQPPQRADSQSRCASCITDGWQQLQK